MCAVDDFSARASDRRRDALAQGAERGATASLHALLDDLLAMQRDLAGEVMPRAARITGTSHLLLQVRSHLDAAIGTARALLTHDGDAPAGEPSMPGASPPRGPWSVEQQALAAVQAARSVT